MNEEFKVKFRGVRGSYPCANKKFMQYGGNTSCVEVRVGGHLIILDAGTGLIELGSELLKDHIMSGSHLKERKPIEATMLLSHIHQDHIIGFTFFAPNHIPTTKLNVFGTSNYNEDLADELAQLLFTKTFPIDLGDIAANLNICDIDETECIILRHGSDPIIKRVSEDEVEILPEDVIITSYKSYAHPQEGVVIYKIEYKGKSLVYATDKETYFGGDKKLANFARGCDLLIHDTQYTTEDYLNPHAPKQGFGHSTFDMALECQDYCHAKKVIFFHFDPSYDDDKLNNIAKIYGDLADKADFAYEGLEINI
ncbi:MAG: MBL fold metallo-hydrolase [Candidatus Melainabacteria bacterium]|nr:MAG: MBL fold metallo-hydrolase [Candidatus Melainabacteria bacterium]